NLRPRPVSVTVPTMMPAPAQVAATFSTPSEPPASAFTSPEPHRPRATGSFLLKTSYGISAVSALRKLVTAETSVAQNTAITGEPARGEQATRRLLAVAGLGEHRIRDRAESHRGGDARPRGTAEQERGEHHRAAGAGRLAAHRREREVDVELAGAGVLQERAVDGEQDDQRRRNVDRDAVDAFQRHVPVPD